MEESAQPASTHTCATGAKRSELKPRYDLIPASVLRRLAQRYAMGAEKYGEYNWQKGMPLSDTLNHVIDHLLEFREKYRNLQETRRLRLGESAEAIDIRKLEEDDDLAGAMWGCAALIWLAENGRLL